MRYQQRHVERQQEHFEKEPFQIVRFLIKNPRFPRTMQKKFRHIADTFEGCGRVLEVGTGRGLQMDLLLGRLASHRTAYVGLDLAAAPLRHARAAVPDGYPGTVDFALAVVEALPFADASFDGAFCVDVLHHAGSQEAMLRELRRVLRPGARLLCVEPNPIYPTNVIFLRDPIEKGIFALKRSNARRWAEAAGLADLEVTDLPVFFPGFPASFAPLYERVERVLARVPGLRGVSTTKLVSARRPPE